MEPPSLNSSLTSARSTERSSRRVRLSRRPRTPTSLTLSATVLASLMLSAVPAQAAPPEPMSTSDDAHAGLDGALDDVVEAGVPGILVQVKDPRAGARRYAAGVNDLATGTALRPTARFRVGSITKTFIATIVLQLAGERRLKLDEPVARRLPGLVANEDRVSVRQLLNHTSGLPDYTADPELFAGIMKNRVWAPQELVALAERQRQQFAPGTAFGYSNTNYIVAGLLIQAVTGHPLALELDRRIFSPLHLDDTSFPAEKSSVPGYHAHGYISTETNPTPDGRPLDVTGYNPSHAWAAGAIVSDAADLSDFYRALMTGELLDRALLRQMKTTVAMDPNDPNSTFRYGLGLQRVDDDCGANWGHDGAIFGFQNNAYWNARTDRSVVISSTMFPAPAAAESARAAAFGLALCSNTL
jgi:D-alanyl-D-alanine carboxypeptidase